MKKELPAGNIRIQLGDFQGWLLSECFRGRAVAPLDHCDDNGEIVDFLGTSYAHYYPEIDSVLRFGKKIGTSSDIVVLADVEVDESGKVIKK